MMPPSGEELKERSDDMEKIDDAIKTKLESRCLKIVDECIEVIPEMDGKKTISVNVLYGNSIFKTTVTSEEKFEDLRNRVSSYFGLPLESIFFEVMM